MTLNVANRKHSNLHLEKPVGNPQTIRLDNHSAPGKLPQVKILPKHKLNSIRLKESGSVNQNGVLSIVKTSRRKTSVDVISDVRNLNLSQGNKEKDLIQNDYSISEATSPVLNNNIP